MLITWQPPYQKIERSLDLSKIHYYFYSSWNKIKWSLEYFQYHGDLKCII